MAPQPPATPPTRAKVFELSSTMNKRNKETERVFEKKGKNF